MPRKAGSGTHYEWVLKDKSSGKLVDGVNISLPSVTTIIGAVIAKPELVQWAYNVTRDAFIGLAGALQDGTLEISDYLESFTDPDDAEEWLRNNKLRPVDQRNDAAERGTAAHLFLEQLMMNLDPQPKTAFDDAILDWYKSKPYDNLISTEQVLYSLTHKYAGTCDLVLSMNEGETWVVDLKTRKEDATAYSTDYVQVDGYATAYEEMTGTKVDGCAVLVARADGTWHFSASRLPRGVFLDTLNLYYRLRERG